MQVALDVLPLSDCKKYYDENPVLAGIDWQAGTMLCAGNPAKRKGVCSGDSGSPLFVPGAGPGRDVQIGIVSFGIGCADMGFPDVFTDVAKMHTWIQRGIQKLVKDTGVPAAVY